MRESSTASSDGATLAEVAVALPVRETYTYRIPPETRGALGCGRRVLVPFGPRTVTGWIVGFPDKAPEGRIKAIQAVPDAEPLFSESHLAFFREVALHTMAPLGEVIRTATPGGMAPSSRSHLALSDRGADELMTLFGDPVDRAILETARRCGPLAPKRLAGEASVAPEAVADAVRRKLLVRVQAMGSDGTRVKTERWVRATDEGLAADREALRVKAPRQVEILDAIEGDAVPWRIVRSAGGTDAALRAAEKKGLVEVFEREALRGPDACAEFAQPRPSALTAEQRAAVDALRETLAAGVYRGFCLHGVTGSGKTEVYLRLIETVVDAGRQAIVLVPEISLTPQLLGRFAGRFPGKVATLHSALSPGERYDEWRRIYRGDARIVIGARSAIFAPTTDLGAIILDEEHDDAFKQEEGVLYDARELAEIRAKDAGCPLLLGSATPSLETYSAAQAGDLTLLELTARVSDVPMPRIEPIDLSAERVAPTGIARLLSMALVKGIEQTLAEGRQAILFLNRRGYASFARCQACGLVVECPDCAISLTYHRADDTLRCHYCGHTRPMPKVCECGKGELTTLGYGTQQVERELKHFFDKARVMRLDRDTTRGKDAFLKLLGQFARGEADVLIGTQMVAKGHDFPGVSFIGIIDADVALHLPDFRASERAFQLLTQVAGRAGRRELQGTVVVQTRDPGHYAIEAAIRHDYKAFFEQEAAFRKELGYPPATALCVIRLASEDAELLDRYGETLTGLLETVRESGSAGAWTWLGPAPAAIPRLRGKWRVQVQLRAKTRDTLRDVLRHLEGSAAWDDPPRGMSRIIDLSPRTIL